MRKKFITLILTLAIVTTLISCNNGTKDPLENRNNVNTNITSFENKPDININKNPIKYNLKYRIKDEVVIEGRNIKEDNDNLMSWIDCKDNLYYFKSKGFDNHQSQFPIFNIDEVKLGNIEDSKDENGFNKVKWNDLAKVKGVLLTGYLDGVRGIRIYDEDKVYKLDKNGEYKEITSYQNIIKAGITPVHYVESQNGKLDVFEGGAGPNRQVKIVDPINDKYYEAYLEDSGEKDSPYNGMYMAVVAVENDRVYVNVDGKIKFKFGYLENGVLKELLTSESLSGIEIKSNIIYSKNNLLFLGTVGSEKGLYKYDLTSNKVEKQADINGRGSIEINSTNDTILICNTDYIDEERPNDGGSSEIYIAKVNDSLNVSKVTNIDSRDVNDKDWVFARGFSEDGKKFYLYKNTNIEQSDTEGKSSSIGYFEVYEIDN